jgi:hypothetical protein
MPSIKFCFRIHIGFHWLGIFCNNCAISTLLFWCIILEEGQKMVLQQESLLVFPFVVILLAPYAIGITKSTSLFIQEGPWEITLLKPFQLLG